MPSIPPGTGLGTGAPATAVAHVLSASRGLQSLGLSADFVVVILSFLDGGIDLERISHRNSQRMILPPRRQSSAYQYKQSQSQMTLHF